MADNPPDMTRPIVKLSSICELVKPARQRQSCRPNLGMPSPLNPIDWLPEVWRRKEVWAVWRRRNSGLGDGCAYIRLLGGRPELRA